MELKINIGYPQVMELIGQLPEQDIQKLVEQIQSRFVNPVSKRMCYEKHAPIRELIYASPNVD